MMKYTDEVFGFKNSLYLVTNESMKKPLSKARWRCRLDFILFGLVMNTITQNVNK